MRGYEVYEALYQDCEIQSHGGSDLRVGSIRLYSEHDIVLSLRKSSFLLPDKFEKN